MILALFRAFFMVLYECKQKQPTWETKGSFNLWYYLTKPQVLNYQQS